MAKHQMQHRNSAHIKKHTVGTSNEISFSVLDSLKLKQESDKADFDPFAKGSGFLFLPFGKKRIQTPAKERGIHDASGKFVSTETPEAKKSTPSAAKASKGRMVGFLPGTALSAASSKKKKSDSSKTEPLPSLGEALDKPGKTKALAAPAHKAAAKPVSKPVSKGSARRGDTADPSFSVKKERRKEERERKRERKERRKESRSVRAEKSVPALSPEEELARRKRRRKVRRGSAAVALSIAIITLLAAGGTYISKTIQQQQNASERLNTALSLISETDDPLRDFDDIVQNPLSLGKEDKKKQWDKQRDETLKKLEQAGAIADDVSLELGDSDKKELADQISVTVASRKELIACGDNLIEAAEKALKTMAAGQEAMAKLLDANSLMTEAGALVLEDSEGNYEKSNEKSAEAVAAFEEAADLFANLSTRYSDLDIEPYTSYCSLAVSCLQHAIASNDALIARDKETAASENEAYNADIAELQTISREMPSSLDGYVKEIFMRNENSLLRRYEAAREQVSSADAFIRDYLGLESK